MRPFARTAALVAALAFAGHAQAADLILRGMLGGGSVVSATESPATGEVAAVLSDDNTLQLDLVFAGLTLGATGAALHTGKFSENGPAVARLDIDAGATEGRIVGAQLALTPLAAAAVRAGESYVVISTIEHPGGEIRGQLMPQPVRLDDAPGMAPAAPATAVPPVEEQQPDEPEEDND